MARRLMDGGRWLMMGEIFGLDWVKIASSLLAQDPLGTLATNYLLVLLISYYPSCGLSWVMSWRPHHPF
jgi:hypothetical protein